MWAYTDTDSDYQSAEPSLQHRAQSASRAMLSALLGAVPAWLRHQSERAQLQQLDDRLLADLGINRGDIPAILAGTFVRPGSGDPLVLADGPGPRGALASRRLAMPGDANPSGQIFGGWVMAMMDAAGAMTATSHADGRVVTAAVSKIAFLHPVQVGDTVCCYTDIVRLGETSMTLDVEVWVLRQGLGDRVRVTEAQFTFVAVNDNGQPRHIERQAAAASG